jgi:membrane protein DedA with SNARE-associated domain
LSIQSLIHSYGYMGVGFILFIEMVGIPFPAETTLILSGVMWTHGVLKFFPLFAAVNIGNILGSTCAYGLGLFLGRPVIVRLGKYVGLTNERLDKGNRIFAKYQILVVLFGKFIAGIRVIIPYLAGINKMPFLKFSLYNALSSFLWTTAFIVIGKYIEELWSHYYTVLKPYMTPVIITAALLIVIFFGIKIWIKRRGKLRNTQRSESSRF